MVLVDTSVLLGYLKGEGGEAVERLEQILAAGIPYGISPLIYYEVLQGVRSEKECRRLKKYLNSMTFYGLRQERDSYAAAALLYFKCRERGFTVRSSMDCLIAQTAIENGLLLLHRDRDFQAIQKVASELKFY